ncbi:hypothetical protein BGZ76_004411 [Entomortierella beljakovae]|nr:hypothetical protein BGZ76_004411 [Entomortierella beljakovae]
MQNDAFKRFSKDLQEVLSIPGGFLHKKKKKSSQLQAPVVVAIEKTSSDNYSVHDITISEVSMTASMADGDAQYLSVSTAKHTPGSVRGASPVYPASGKIFPKEEPPIIHCPPSISSLEHFSPQRRAWIQNWSQIPTSGQLSNVLKTGQAWDTVDDIMQVTNKATSKIFDVEWNLRVGNVERTSYPARSFKDNPDKAVRTYKLQRTIEDSKSGIKSDCEVVFMIGLHVLEEPVEDRSWETAMLYQGFLTIMTKGGRLASWKRYWAVLEGRAMKLYDAEYQQKRSVLGVIPLAYILHVQPPDYEKVDVGSNGFSMLIDPHGVDMDSRNSSHDDPSELDYCVYAFTDSSHLYEVWNAHLDEALEQYQVNIARRNDLQKAKIARRATRSLSRHSFESSLPPSPLEEESDKSELVDLKYIW